MNDRLEKIYSSFTLPRIITMKNFTKLNHFLKVLIQNPARCKPFPQLGCWVVVMIGNVV
jgi:hypothetical protein